MLTIENAGGAITATNYFDSEPAVAGKMFLSMNAGAFRLLVPDSVAATITAEVKAAKEIIISLGPWPEAGKEKAVELLFEDGSEAPYCLHLSGEQTDRWPMPADDGRPFLFAAWGRGPELLIEHRARLRFVPRLPYLRPWGK